MSDNHSDGSTDEAKPITLEEIRRRSDEKYGHLPDDERLNQAYEDIRNSFNWIKSSGYDPAKPLRELGETMSRHTLASVIPQDLLQSIKKATGWSSSVNYVPAGLRLGIRAAQHNEAVDSEIGQEVKQQEAEPGDESEELAQQSIALQMGVLGALKAHGEQYELMLALAHEQLSGLGEISEVMREQVRKMESSAEMQAAQHRQLVCQNKWMVAGTFVAALIALAAMVANIWSSPVEVTLEHPPAEEAPSEP